MQITDNRLQLLNICTDSVFKTLFKYPQIVLFLRDNDHLIDVCAPYFFPAALHNISQKLKGYLSPPYSGVSLCCLCDASKQNLKRKK